MKSIKYLIMLVCMTLGLANVAKAQIYCNETCIYDMYEYNRPGVYYHYSLYMLVKFDGQTVKVYGPNGSGGPSFTLTKSDLEKGYEKSSSYADDLIRNSERTRTYTYDYNLSTSTKEVYKCTYFNKPMTGNRIWYIAIDKDLNTVVRWFEDSYSSGIKEKINGNRVDPEIFKPKSQSEKYDFLYD